MLHISLAYHLAVLDDRVNTRLEGCHITARMDIPERLELIGLSLVVPRELLEGHLAVRQLDDTIDMARYALSKG